MEKRNSKEELKGFLDIIPRESTRKTQKLEEDAEKEELKGFLDIIPREEVPIEVESLSTKFPIVDWKTCALTKNFMYYQIFRGDGSSKNYKILSEMLEDFDRQDVEELYRLVQGKVIENGNSWVPIPVTAPESRPSTALKMTVPSTAEEKICKKNDYVDAQSMFAAIKARFRGNKATKKTQKALLKQQYENFNASSSEFNTVSTETSTTSLSDATVYAFLSTQPQGSQLVYEDLEQLHDDDLEEMDLKWNMALLSMRARKFYQRTGRKIIIDGSGTAGYDKSKVECFNCHKMGYFARECRAPRSKDNINWNQGSSSKAVRIEDAFEKTMCAIDGAGFDWSDMAEEEIKSNTCALMAILASVVTNDKSCSKSCLQNYEALKKQYDDLLVKLDDTGFKAATYKRGLSILERQILKYKEFKVLFSEEIALLKRSVGQGDLMLLSPQHVGFGNPSNPMVHHWFSTNIITLMHEADPMVSSRHMSGNIAHLSDFKYFDGGYVTFGGGANRGRITGKVAKTTSEESMLWHRRLGHINLKNINKLVKENLVFFLTTNDETSEILKNFIKEVENLVDKKVKIIKSDNGTEFKNKVMDDFYREKGIKREYSVARTPQQNGVAERKNRTLIEAARTMLADSKLPTTFGVAESIVSIAC
ncbi:ribonuclease H-like domain-containing protein [Tanacetum coccineum]